MATKFLDKTGLSHFWGKIKAWCSSTFAAIAHTHTSYAIKHSYTTAANAAKNWYRIANANTSQLDTTKPIRAQFIVTAYNTSYAADYYETWFVNAIVFGRTAHIVIFGGSGAPFNQARILYENTVANIDANDRPAIDLYLNHVLPNGTTKIEVEEIYNSGWTFVADGQLAASTVPSGFESVASTIRNNGIDRSTTADYASYLNRQISNITTAFTLADSYLYRSRTLNCTGTFTITIPSINSGYMWCVIKNKNTSSGVITLHPSTTSVLINGSNADIKLQPMEYVCIHSAGANNYSLIADGRWKSQKADKATTLAGYGITDAKIANGTITLGSNSITPITSIDDSNYVHKTGNEDISGVKTFTSQLVKSTNEYTLDYNVGSSYIEPGVLLYKNTANNTDLAYLFFGRYSDGANAFRLRTKNSDGSIWGDLGVYCASDGHVYAAITSGSGGNDLPPDNENSGTLATTKWVRRYCETTKRYITSSGSITGNAATASAVAWSGVTSKPTTIAGYGITDAKIANGTITLGSNSITPLTSVPSHNQASDTINAMTGYSKPSSGSAVIVSDSLNSAIGKLEAKIDAIDDSNLVHKNRNETISGQKSFINNIVIPHPDLTKGTQPSRSIYQHILFTDKNEQYYNSALDNNRISAIYNAVYSGNSAETMITIYPNSTNYTSANIGYLGIGVTASGDLYTVAPTPQTSDNSTNIATTAFVKAQGYLTSHQDISNKVSKTGDETIAGIKSFSSLLNRVTNIDYNSDVNNYFESTLVQYHNPSANHDLAYLIYGRYTNNNRNTNGIRMRAISPTGDWGDLGLYITADNYVYAYIAGPAGHEYLSPDDSNDATLATTRWIRRYCENTKNFLTSSNASNTYLTQSSASSTYLKLTSNNEVTTFHFIHRNVENSGLCIGGGASTESGGNIILYGPTAGNGGRVYIRAKTSSSDEKTLALYPSGSATWNGQTIQTSSDERIKTKISNVNSDILDAWEDVQWGEFQFLDAVAEKGDSARYHIGLIAQAVDRVFQKHNADILKYGILCHEEREETENDKAVDLWMVRYTEALAMEAAYQRRKNKILESRISELEKRLAKLEGTM